MLRPLLPGMLLVLLGACATTPPPISTPSDNMGAIPVIAAPAVPASFRSVRLEQPAGAFPALTVAVPPSWQHASGQGDDSRTHTFTGDGVRVEIATWPHQWSYCKLASCGLIRMPVGDRFADIVTRTSSQLRAFIPVLASPGGAGPSRGIDFRAQCSSQAACDDALRVLASMRFS